MDAGDFLLALAELRREAGSGPRAENSVVMELVALVDDIGLALQLQAPTRHGLLMARAIALAGDPSLAIARIETILRCIATP
jgi:hypothetical protein